MAAASAVLSTPKPSSSVFAMASHQRINTNVIPPIASSSRSPPLVQDTPSTSTFNRLASIKQSIRTATRSRKAPAPEADEFATLTSKTVKGKGKEKATATAAAEDPKERMNMFGKLGSKVTFRRPRRESLTPSPMPPRTQDSRVQFMGSLRGASISSPALHLSSQALPSPKSQPSVPASSSSGADVLVSPTRTRQPPQTDISSPAPLVSRRERHPRESPTRQRTTPRPSLDMDSPPDTPSPSPHRGRLVRMATIRPAAAHPEPSSPSSLLQARSPSQPRVVTPTSHRGLVSASVTNLPPAGASPTIVPPRRSSLDATRRSIDSARRPSVDAPRRVSGETPRRVSGETPRRTSPVDYRVDSPTPVRRATSPYQKSYSQNRHYNISSASLISPQSYNPENRELLRTAASMLCKEMIRPPPHMNNKSEAWAEVERRMQPLVRLERIWGMSSTIASASNLNLANSGSGSGGLGSGGGEERERRVFCEALRDGFVLCQLMNKLRSGNAVRADPREDGREKVPSNIIRFLPACASYGLQNEDLFLQDDLIEGSSESLARVAHTIIILIQFVETPAPSRIKWIKPHTDPSSNGPLSPSSPSGSASSPASASMARNKSPTMKSTISPSKFTTTATSTTGTGGGGAGSSHPKTAAGTGPYMKGSLGRASASVPNLGSPLSTSPPTNNHPSSPSQRKRYSPPAGLPPLHSDNSEEGHNTPKTRSPRKLQGDMGAGGRSRHGALSPSPVVGASRSRSRVDVNVVEPSGRQEEKQQAEEDEDEEGMVEIRDRPIPVPHILKPPPPPAKSPLRAPSVKRNRVLDDGGISAWVRSAASPPPTSPSPNASRISTTTMSANNSSTSSQPQPRPRQGYGAGISRINSMAAESTRASIGNASFLESPIVGSPSSSNDYSTGYARHRQSVASTAVTDTTATTQMSSILDNTPYLGGHSPSGHNQYAVGGGSGGKFGTIRTMTTDLTSESMMGSPTAEMGDEVKGGDVFGNGPFLMMSHSPPVTPAKSARGDSRERRVSANHGHAVDLTRVAEEPDESSSSGGHGKGKERERQIAREREEREGEREQKGKGRVEVSSPTRGLGRLNESKPTASATDHNKVVHHRAVHLHQAKWPDDFMDAFQMRNPSPAASIIDPEERSLSSSSIRASSPAHHRDVKHLSNTNSSSTPMSRSVSPPRKLAIVGRRPDDPSSSSLSLAPRRPSHLSRHSVDTAGHVGGGSGFLSSSPGTTSGLLPKLRGRDVSPDGVALGNKLMIRRSSANKSPLPALGSPRTGSSLSMTRNAAGTPDSDSSGRDNGGVGVGAGVETLRDLARARSEKRGSGGSGGSGQSSGGSGGRKGGGGNGVNGRRQVPVPVPFPRTVSVGDQSGTPSPSSRMEVNLAGGGGNTSTNASGADNTNEKPRLPRGRFQSEINGSSRMKPRPNSYDEVGARPSRTRFESMVNLGRTDSAQASASDLMARDSMDGSAVRKTLVVKEEGKPPTHFQLGNCIGRGQFGSVYRALNLNTGQMVAVKRIRLEGLKEDEISTLMREVDLVKRLSHPGIVKYEGMARDEDTLNIVLEYAENGSLTHTLKAFGKLNEKLVASYVVKILEGLHYLHQSDVVHCDLKAVNILTTKNGNVKLSDFGVSLNLRAMERQTQNDVAGTPNWMAPEVIELKGASTKSDIWSLGCTVVELLTGRPPYADISNSMTVMFRIVEDDTPPIPEGCSEMLQDFLEQCFQKEPAERPSAEMLCEHPWLKNNWGALQDLRPQDSIPFLRRVSADMQQKSDMVRHFAKGEFPPESPTASEFPFLRDFANSPPPMPSSSPAGRRTSITSTRQSQLDPEQSPGDHNFVKTTFSKPVVCRVCLENVKKTAVLCAKCSLISHSKCAPNAPPTCDLRSQLLLYAQYAEHGNPPNIYSNPLSEHPETSRGAASTMSDVPLIAHQMPTPRTSIDTPSPQPNHHLSSSHHGSPPGAFKFMAAFKRSRSNLNNEVNPASSTPASEPDLPNSRSTSKDTEKPSDLHFEERTPIPRRRPTSILQKRSKERPRSYTSNSTGLSSLRSAATAAESLNSSGPTETGRLSQLSNAGNAGTSSSQERKAGTVAKEAKRGKKKSNSVQIPPVSSSAVVSDHETNAFAELSTTSSILPGSFSWDPSSRRTRSKRDSKDPKQSGNCIVQ